MTDGYIRAIGTVTDMNGSAVRVGVDYDTVTISTGLLSPACFTQAQAEEFAQLFVSACWQAGANARQMAQEIHEADGGDTMAGGGGHD